MRDESNINYTREAFLHPLNLGFLLLLVLAALFASEMPWVPTLVLTAGLGLDLLYLGTVPESSRFREYIHRRIGETENEYEKQKQHFSRLSVVNQKRFLAVKRIHDQIGTQFAEMPASSRLLVDSLRPRIMELLDEYLRYLSLEERFHEYLLSTSPEALLIEIRALEKEIREVRSERLREVKSRRMNLLKKRYGKLRAASERSEIYRSHQQTIEDALLYIYEKSLTLSHYETTPDQIDRLLLELDDTTAIIKEMEHESITEEGHM